MCASRFELLTKKDQDVVRRFVERRRDVMLEPDKILANHYATFQDNVNGLATRPKGRYAYNSAADIFASEMSFIASRFIQRGIALRLLHDDVPELVEATFVASRLEYLSDLAKRHDYSGTDCLHVFDVLSSLGARDHAAAAALIRRHPGPARDGHPFTVLLCNAVTGLMTRSGALPELKERLIHRNEGAYNKAMLQGLVAIIDGDPTDTFIQELAEMVRKEPKPYVRRGRSC